MDGGHVIKEHLCERVIFKNFSLRELREITMHAISLMLIPHGSTMVPDLDPDS
ncbi:MAG: hypothetical protein HC767_10485 [Akkermansiaceae bacterium]|nr:hypothetical protein [Akkermansiaceae bacterium]